MSAENDDLLLANVMRRAIAKESFYVDTELGWITLDGGLSGTEEECEVIERLWKAAHGD